MNVLAMAPLSSTAHIIPHHNRFTAIPSGLTSASSTIPFFYRPDALLAAQPTVSKHWRQLAHSDSGEDARVLLNSVTCTVSVPLLPIPYKKVIHWQMQATDNDIGSAWFDVQIVAATRRFASCSCDATDFAER